MQVTITLILLLSCAVAVVSCTKSPFARLSRPVAALLSSATVLFSGDAARAEPPALELYTNAQWHTSLQHPADWVLATATLSGERTLVAFTAPGDSDTSASLVFTPVPGDYSKIGSFGIDTIKRYMVPSGEGVETSLIKESSRGDSYSLEYVVSLPDAPTRHVYSTFALRSAETVVGLTVQTKEADYAKNKAVLEAIVPTLNTNAN